MDSGSRFDDGAPGLVELQALQELSRAILPLSTAQDVARDGLLCLAGITAIGAGALVWRASEQGPFELLSYFGLGSARLRERFRIPSQIALPRSAPLALETARRRTAWGKVLDALEPLPARVGDGWVLALAGERRPRGILLLGRPLVAGADESVALLAPLAEMLRLALVGRTGGARSRAANRIAAERQPPRTHAGRSVTRRLAALRRAQPASAELRGTSPATLALLEEIVRLAPTNYTVLLHGETGTGKELVARLLHRSSRRATGVFEAVDCSAIPRELIESELFGHVRGAFTGATRDYAGAFERADGGTLLLDEIGDMDLRSQTRLLRVLQERSVRRVGGDRAIPVDVRVVAASNRDLGALVRAGRFREDLYYRIHVCPVYLPPLRDRGDDRLVLFEAFMKQSAHELGRRPRLLSPAARRRLRADSLPGNVRQLQNVARQLLVGAAGRAPISGEEMEAVLRRAALIVDRARAEAAFEGGPAAEADSPARDVEVDNPETERAGIAGLDHAPRAPGAGSGQARRTGGREPDFEVAAGAPELPPVEDVGIWVIEQLRRHRFNLLAAARELQAWRQRGARREAVPVLDRGALDYYWCGEFFHRLVRSDFAFDRVVQDLAGERLLQARVRRKARALVAALQTEGADSRLVWRRMPEAYHPDLEATRAALRAGTWSLPAV